MISKTMNEDITTYHLADNPQLYTPSRDNNFIIYIDIPENLLKPGIDASTANAETDYFNKDTAQEVLAISVTSSAVPHFTQNEVAVKRGNTTVYFPGTPEWQPIQLEFIDYMGASTKDILLALQGKSYDVTTGTIPSTSKIKFSSTLIEYTPDNRQVRYWDIKGGWIKGISEVALNSESQNARKVTVDLRYDLAIPHMPDSEEIVTNE